MRIKNNALLIIIALLFLHLSVNFYILNKSEVIRIGDDASGVSERLRFYHMLPNTDYRTLNRFFLRLYPPSHPKLFLLIEGLTMNCLDKIGLKDINLMILFSNALFIFILLISVFKIGSMLYDRKVGLLAAGLLSFSPLIFGHSRMSMLDLPLTAMVSLYILSLLKTNHFSSLFFSLAAGILFGLAQFTKETAFIFILPVSLYYSFRSFAVKEKIKERSVNFSLSVLLSAVLAGTVYFNPVNKGIFKTYWGKSFLISNQSDALFYIKCFPLFYWGIFFSLILLPLILSYLSNVRKRNIFLILWSFAPLAIFSISPNKTCRFIMPILPPLFLMLASEVYSPYFLKIRKTYAAILVFSVFFQYTMFNFFPKAALYPPSYHIFSYDIQDCGLLSVNRNSDFHLIEKLVNVFEKEKTPLGRGNTVMFTFRLGFESALECQFRLRDMPFAVSCPQTADQIDAPPPGKVDWGRCLLTADYVVDRTGGLGDKGSLEDISARLKASLEQNAHFFKKVAGFKDSKGESISVYKNIKKIDDFMG